MRYSQPPAKLEFSSVTCCANTSLTTKNVTPSPSATITYSSTQYE